MSEAAVAERYARAIYELGEQSGELATVAQQLGLFSDTLGGSLELSVVLNDPSLDEAKRDAIVRDVASRLGFNPTTSNAVRLLSSRQRLKALPEIAARLQSLADEKDGIVRVKVTSAKPLSEGYYQKLSTEVSQATGRRVVLQTAEDPSLISGVVTQIGDNTIDGSLKGRLQEYEQQLLSAE